MFTGLLHHLPTFNYIFFYLFYWIQQESKRLRQEISRGLWRRCIGARERTVRNKKIEQVIVATFCDWLKTSRHLTDQSTRPLKPYASGSYLFPGPRFEPAFKLSLLVLIGRRWTESCSLTIHSLQELSLFYPLLLKILVHLRWLSAFSL